MRFIFQMARREIRSSWRRLLFFFLCIGIGTGSIIALRSTAGGASTVVPALRGPVTTARADVDVVVTEHGTAWLRGCPLSGRAARMVAIAAPEHREDLHREIRESS